MPTANLTRKITFAAAHRYYRPDWTSDQNRQVFGACANPHGHGHNYRLEVTVAAPIDPITGFSTDITALDALLDREVTQQLDHQHLNHSVPEFREGGLIPTSENILVWLWPRIARGVPQGSRIVSMRLHEDDTFFVDYAGPDA